MPETQPSLRECVEAERQKWAAFQNGDDPWSAVDKASAATDEAVKAAEGTLRLHELTALPFSRWQRFGLRAAELMTDEMLIDAARAAGIDPAALRPELAEILPTTGGAIDE